MRNKPGIKKMSSFIVCIALALSFTHRVHASEIQPANNRFEIKAGTELQSSIKYRNTEETKLQLTIESHKFNPKNKKEILTTVGSNSQDSVFITFPDIENSSIIVSPKSEVEIPYTISIPNDTDSGTYYNFIGVIASPVDQAQLSLEDSKAGISTRHGIGVKVQIDVLAGESTPYSEANTQVDLNINVINKGSIIQPTKFTVDLVNNSRFTYKPIGSIEVLGEWKDKDPISLDFNQKESELMPGETISQTYTLNLWSIHSIEDFIHLLEKKTLAAKVIPEENTVLTNMQIINPIYTPFIILLTIILVTTVIILIYRKKRSK
ncbi:hypothetical protein GF357_00295 [Candidatus Dojkabacteria bacterium]|nr:hypothetical protein [Candidatus Dojkabacteria bacterium]